MTRHTFTLAAAVVLAVAAFTLGAAAIRPPIAHSEPCVAETPPQLVPSPQLATTIRNTGNGWSVISDDTHTPVGVASVQVFPDRVRVFYDFAAVSVMSLQATPDEAFAAADVRVGASVGIDYVDIYFYLPAYGTTPVNPALLTREGANVWITGWFI